MERRNNYSCGMNKSRGILINNMRFLSLFNFFHFFSSSGVKWVLIFKKWIKTDFLPPTPPFIHESPQDLLLSLPQRVQSVQPKECKKLSFFIWSGATSVSNFPQKVENNYGFILPSYALLLFRSSVRKRLECPMLLKMNTSFLCEYSAIKVR